MLLYNEFFLVLQFLFPDLLGKKVILEFCKLDFVRCGILGLLELNPGEFICYLGLFELNIEFFEFVVKFVSCADSFLESSLCLYESDFSSLVLGFSLAPRSANMRTGYTMPLFPLLEIE